MLDMVRYRLAVMTRERIEYAIDFQRRRPGDCVFSPSRIREMLAQADFDISEYEVQLSELDIIHAQGQIRRAIGFQSKYIGDCVYDPSRIREFIEHARSLGIDVSSYEEELCAIKKKIVERRLEQLRR